VRSDATKPDVDVRGYGDYEGLVVANGVARPIWTDLRDNGSLSSEIYTATVTLAELGAPTDPPVVGAAVVEGFRAALDRAYAACVPYLVNVITDVEAAYPRNTFGI